MTLQKYWRSRWRELENVQVGDREQDGLSQIQKSSFSWMTCGGKKSRKYVLKNICAIRQLYNKPNYTQTWSCVFCPDPSRTCGVSLYAHNSGAAEGNLHLLLLLTEKEKAHHSTTLCHCFAIFIAYSEFKMNVKKQTNHPFFLLIFLSFQ